MRKITWSKIKQNSYAITEDGKVYSYYKKDFMTTSIDKDGYEVVSLITSENQHSHFGIHRLLMITYHPCENMENLTVNHIDGNKKNNSFSNLEWVTASENTRLAHETNLNNTVGENHGKAKLSEDEAKLIIKMIKEGKGLKEIKLAVPQLNKNMLNHIKRGDTWKHIPR